MSHLPTFSGVPWPFLNMEEATSSSSVPKSMDVAAARRTSALAPTQMAILSSSPFFLAVL